MDFSIKIQSDIEDGKIHSKFMYLITVKFTDLAGTVRAHVGGQLTWQWYSTHQQVVVELSAE